MSNISTSDLEVGSASGTAYKKLRSIRGKRAKNVNNSLTAIEQPRTASNRASSTQQLLDRLDPEDPAHHTCTEIGLWCMRAIKAKRLGIGNIIANTFQDRQISKIILPAFLLPDLVYFDACYHSEDLEGHPIPVSLCRWSDKAQITPSIGRPVTTKAKLTAEMAEVDARIKQFTDKVTHWLDHVTPEQITPFQDDIWSKNLEALSQTLALSPVEAGILRFAVLSQFNQVLGQIEVTGTGGGFFLMCSAADHCNMLGDLLQLPHTEVRAALMPGRILIRSSILSFKYRESGTTSLRLDESILNAILAGTPETLFSGSFTQTTATKLVEQDFQYCEDQLTVLKTYLRHCLATKQRGVNVLLYGAPGVGKSELAKVMANALSVPLYQIAEESEDKSAKDREGRLAAYCLTQEVLHNGPHALVLFDEVEDIFASPDSEASSAQKAKGFVNRLLEENIVPTFWITNSCNDMDAAVLRRFDIVIRMTIPPRDTRLKIARHYFRDVGEPPSYLLDVNLTAADFARIAKVATVLRASGQESDQCIGVLATEYLKLFGAQHKVLQVRNGYELPFDPLLCTAKVDLDILTQQLHRQGNAVLLTGPAGSGKAATAHYLGDKLGLVISKSATDLIGEGPFGTVHHIRNYVEQLRREGAVGLIEHLDILVKLTRDRDVDNTVITEGLADLISRHTGTIFVCCSEPVQRLPVALINCFSVKLDFEPLTGQQCRQYCAAACQVQEDHFANGLSMRVSRLAGIVPQAFTNVLRTAQLLGHEITPDYLLAALEQEAELLRSGGRKVGFC
jgi:transitional endoplasmic reticulum ATPase